LSFSDFNLQKDFISSIEAAGYDSPTPLQSQLIPLVAEKKSALIWTQSAAGKTGAFLIPTMNYILENPAPEKRGARVLILTSRRDRVSQINYTIKRLSKDHTMRFGFIVSGRPYQTQMRLMRRPLDIMIATPGRLNDLMNNGKADFSQLEMLVIDDLTSIYQKNLHGLVESILSQASPECQSITFLRGNDELTPYAKSLFPNAVDITIDEDNEGSDKQEITNKESSNITSKKTPQERKTQPKTPSINIKDLMPQKVHIADDYTHKIAMMDHLMDEYAGESTLIYVATNKAAKILLDNLANHGHAAELIQDLSPDERDACDILIYSDQEKINLSSEDAAKNDQHIIHFDLPYRTDIYLKRLEKHNQDREEPCLLMIDGYNYNELKHIEKTLGEKLSLITVPGLEPLKPFVNLSKPKKQFNKKNSNQRNTSRNTTRPNNKPRQNTKNRNSNQRKNTKSNPNSNTNQNRYNTRTANSNDNDSNTDNKQRRQRKGPFGRLNGGANRKANSGRNTTHTRNSNNNRNNNARRTPKVGVSSRGTGAPQGNRGWQSDFAEPQERKTESKNVVIRYSKKRTIPANKDKPDEV